MTISSSFPFKSSPTTDTNLPDRSAIFIATTPRVDRSDEIVDPMGCVNPIGSKGPFLTDHKNELNSIAGEWTILSKDATGIKILTRFNDSQAATVALGIVREQGLSCSIGFRTLDWKYDSAGRTVFTQWELLEVSGVAVPCNPDARTVSVSAKHKKTLNYLGQLEQAERDARGTPSWCMAVRALDEARAQYRTAVVLNY